MGYFFYLHYLSKAPHDLKIYTSEGLGLEKNNYIITRFCDIFSTVEPFANPLLKHTKVYDNI